MVHSIMPKGKENSQRYLRRDKNQNKDIPKFYIFISCQKIKKKLYLKLSEKILTT